MKWFVKSKHTCMNKVHFKKKCYEIRDLDNTIKSKHSSQPCALYVSYKYDLVSSLHLGDSECFSTNPGWGSVRNTLIKKI